MHAVRRSLESGLVALGQGPVAALPGYVEAAEDLRALGVPFDLALSQLDFVTVGPDSPEARKAGDEAAEIFTGLGAKPFSATSSTPHRDYRTWPR